MTDMPSNHFGSVPYEDTLLPVLHDADAVQNTVMEAMLIQGRQIAKDHPAYILVEMIDYVRHSTLPLTAHQEEMAGGNAVYLLVEGNFSVAAIFARAMEKSAQLRKETQEYKLWRTLRMLTFSRSMGNILEEALGVYAVRLQADPAKDPHDGK